MLALLLAAGSGAVSAQQSPPGGAPGGPGAAADDAAYMARQLAPDLDVQLVAPEDGDATRWRAEVANRGRAFAQTCAAAWSIDGVERERLRLAGFAAGERRVFVLALPPGAAVREVAFAVFPRPHLPDACAANDRRAVAHPAWGVHAVAHEAVARFLDRRANLHGSLSFADWLHAHVAQFNALLADAERRHLDGRPLGRVRLERVDLVPDDCPLPEWPAARTRLRWDFHRALVEDPPPDGRAPADWRLSPEHARRWTGRYKREPTLVRQLDWALLHEFGHGLGLVDLYPFTVYADELPAAFGIPGGREGEPEPAPSLRGGEPAGRNAGAQHAAPLPASPSRDRRLSDPDAAPSAAARAPVLPFPTDSLMGHEYARGLSRFHALALARRGPTAPLPDEASFGAYLLELPERLPLALVDEEGNALPGGGRLELFQARLAPERGYYGRRFPAAADAVFAPGAPAAAGAQRAGSVSDGPEKRAGSVSDGPEKRTGSVSDGPEKRAGSVSDGPAAAGLPGAAIEIGRGVFGADFLRPPHPFRRAAAGVAVLRWTDGATCRYGALTAPAVLEAAWTGASALTVPMTVAAR